MKYLYGAAVQGIQNFIFQTNELKDIVGASELVENICTVKFEELLKKHLQKDFNSLEEDENAIINAAGNIKYIFESEEECASVVKEFPKVIIQYAPGITISQAVVEYNQNQDFSVIVDELEQKLRAQRNRPMQSTTLGLMGILRSRRTNLPVVEKERNRDGQIDYLDAATLAKRYHVKHGQKMEKRNVIKLAKEAFGMMNLKPEEVALDIDDMTGFNDWVAVIHADGNGLGQVVQKIGSKKDEYKRFSRKLDKATKAAAIVAFNSLAKNHNWNIIPIRPIVLGGDDLTVICRADLALDYVTAFIENFEKYTAFDELDGVFLNNEKKLTACAGIAFIKSSYPFYYGYSLAEALCTRAKADAKKGMIQRNGQMSLPPSCLMFHKVQDSFVEQYSEIVKRELSPQKNISFEFGPYYILSEQADAKNKWSVEKLKKHVDLLDGIGLKDEKKGNAVKSYLRNWLTLLHDNPGLADQKRIRLMELLDTNNEDDKKLKAFVKEITAPTTSRLVTPCYDILSLLTVNTQITKEKEAKE